MLKFVMSIRLAKIISTLIIITLFPLIKYIITGNIYIDGRYLWTNIGIGLIVFYLKTNLNGLFTYHLNKRDINVSLKQILFGFKIEYDKSVFLDKIPFFTSHLGKHHSYIKTTEKLSKKKDNKDINI
jgi:hypothetical protein